MKFSSEDCFSKFDLNPQETANLATFTEEILNGKLHFLCSVRVQKEKLWCTLEDIFSRRTLTN